MSQNRHCGTFYGRAVGVYKLRATLRAFQYQSRLIHLYRNFVTMRAGTLVSQKLGKRKTEYNHTLIATFKILLAAHIIEIVIKRGVGIYGKIDISDGSIALLYATCKSHRTSQQQ